MGCAASKKEIKVGDMPTAPNQNVASDSPVNNDMDEPNTKTANNNDTDENEKNQNDTINKNSTNSLQTLNIDEEKKPVEINNEKTINENGNILLPGSEVTSAKRERSISILTDDGAYDDLDIDDIIQNDIDDLSQLIGSTNPDEKHVVRLIIKGNQDQVESLKQKYLETHNEELLIGIRKCTSGHVKSILTNILTSTENYLASLLNGFLKCGDMLSVTEVLTAWRPNQIQSAKESYCQLYGSRFTNDVTATMDDTFTDSLKNIIIPLSHLQRNNINVEHLDEQENIENEINQLNEGGENIVQVLTQRPYSNTQLANIFSQYKLKYYLDLKDSIELDFHDSSQHCLKAIVDIATNVAKYFSQELHNAFVEKNEARIIHIINSRYQNDLSSIHETFDNEFAQNGNLISQIETVFEDDNLVYALIRMIKKTKR